MEFACYTKWGELPDCANTLFEQAEKKSIFFSQAWFGNLVENGSHDGQRILLACVIAGGKVFAILPLEQRDSTNYQSLKHLYSSLFTLLLAEERQDETLQCLVAGLRQLPAHSVQLDPVSETDQNIHRLQAAMESSGFSCHRYFRFYNWIHRVQGESFAVYLANRPSRVRHTIARKRRKLEREEGYHIRLFTDSDLPQAIRDYTTVYNASWKANEVFEPFVKGLAERFMETGWLRLAILYIGNQPAAAQLWFVAHGKASIFKLAYDEAWKQYSPGSLLIAYLMEYVIDTDKVDEIDFLTGNDTYKQDWMSERRTRFRLSFINTNPTHNEGNYLVKPLYVLLKWLKDKVYNHAFATR